MGQLIPVSKLKYQKDPQTEVDRIAVAYSLYKYAESKGIRTFRVADLYSETNVSGIVKEFGISKSDFTNILRSLNSDANRLIVAELNMGLDSITLREDIHPIDVLNAMI